MRDTTFQPVSSDAATVLISSLLGKSPFLEQLWRSRQGCAWEWKPL